MSRMNLPEFGAMHILLAEFAAKLDVDRIREVGCCAMKYLVSETEPTDSLPRCWLN